MSLAIVATRAQLGVTAPAVTVEVHLAGGLPGTSIVGLPEAAVREARDRVRAALIASQWDYPQRRVTINLAPADLPKHGSRFDLAIALGILAASGQIPPAALARTEFLGELALSGELRAVSGVLPAVIRATQAGNAVIVPAGNAAEATLVRGAEVRVAKHLLDVCAHVREMERLPRQVALDAPPSEVTGPDLIDVRGQALARRALEIAAAGAHNVLMIGPPGSGKTMLATRLAGILPSMSEDEALEVAAVASVAGHAPEPARLRTRPTRAPHHSASAIALVGGGGSARPGEVSLAHHGVLFLDELPEFSRHALEMLREPMESGRVLISRAARQSEYPARFQLVAAMNPCPCGYAGDVSGRCRCGPDAIARYRARISGPLLDRIDLHVPVARLARAALRGEAEPSESSIVVRTRVARARARQLERTGKANAWLDNRETERHASLCVRDQHLLEHAVDKLGLSARAYHRILRVARTIADLADSDTIATAHLSEAIGYRQLDRAPM